MPVTIRDVAALAQVSPSTVSRTIRNSSSISKKTQERVRQAMAELGYEAPASSESKEEERAIPVLGIILPPSVQSAYENPFYLEVIRGITQYSNLHHCLTATITGKDDQETIQAMRALQKPDFICSFIVLFSRSNDPIVEYLYNEGIDYVQIGSPSSHPLETVCVDNDNISAGHDAAAYLHSLGHTRIGFAGSPSSELYSASRRRGYRMFMSENSLFCPPEYSLEMEQADEAGLRKLSELIDLSNPLRPTALILSDDIYAVMVRQLCAEKGIQIPQDLSLISFNNSIFSRLNSPAITSINVNALQLGIEAASQALNHLENPGMMASRTMVPYQIVERESCLDLRQKQQ